MNINGLYLDYLTKMETLFHFRCERCEARWAADDQVMSEKHYCPHCGSELKALLPIWTKLLLSETERVEI